MWLIQNQVTAETVTCSHGLCWSSRPHVSVYELAVEWRELWIQKVLPLGYSSEARNFFQLLSGLYSAKFLVCCTQIFLFWRPWVKSGWTIFSFTSGLRASFLLVYCHSPVGETRGSSYGISHNPIGEGVFCRKYITRKKSGWNIMGIKRL